MRVHVICVGTPRGQDATGLVVAAVLARRTLPPGVVVHTCQRPVPDLLEALEGADAAVIVDAARTGAAPGTLQRLTPGELARGAAGSSHGLGVGHALRLAVALGRAPARVEVVGVEIASEAAMGATPGMRAAVAAAEEVLALARALARR